jgi:hypothetical protein
MGVGFVLGPEVDDSDVGRRVPCHTGLTSFSRRFIFEAPFGRVQLLRRSTWPPQ